MVWTTIGMTLFRKFSKRQLFNQPDMILSNGMPSITSSTVTQAQKKLGNKVIESVF